MKRQWHLVATMQKLLMSVASLGLGAALLAPSAGAQTTTAPAALKPVTVNIVQRAKFEPPTWGFDPMVITIPPGTTVTWKSIPGNSDGHTSTSNDVWNSPLLNPGDTWSFTFSKAGRYRYHCALHPWMVGVVDVVAGASVEMRTGGCLNCLNTFPYVDQ
jgi:plastocyanin